MAEEQVRAGGCLCGAVRYRVRGAMRPVVVCHCGQCRRTHGHAAAYTSAPSGQIDIVESAGLRWYESTPGYARGFCERCGASLFWERSASPTLSIAAGTLDVPTGLTTAGHLFVADASDYELINDGLPQFPGPDDGALAPQAAAAHPPPRPA